MEFQIESYWGGKILFFRFNDLEEQNRVFTRFSKTNASYRQLEPLPNILDGFIMPISSFKIENPNYDEKLMISEIEKHSDCRFIIASTYEIDKLNSFHYLLIEDIFN